MIWTAGSLAGGTWLVLTFPVLVAGLIRFRGSLLPVAWAGAWATGVTLMVLAYAWADNVPTKMTCGGNGCGVTPVYGLAIVDWRELAICGAWLAVAAAMTLILARPPAGFDPALDAGRVE